MNWHLGQCALGHLDRLRERDPETGRLMLVCPRCGDAVMPLKDQPLGEPIELPKAQAAKWWEAKRA